MSAPAVHQEAAHLGWGSIVRLGLVQTSLGAIVVLMLSTINRVMVLELALPAVVPGALVTLHYAVQALRPRWGYGSDVGGRRTPWIIGGMALLAIGGVGASVAVGLAMEHLWAGLALAVVAFLVIGIGVGAAGTSLLALLATRTQERRRGAAATIVWVMMIAGFAVTAPLAGRYLDPFSAGRLVAVTATVAVIAFLVSVLAVWGVESRVAEPRPAQQATAKPPFREALREVWAEPEARRFTIFIFVSMLAYSAQDLILEPFAGLVFGMTPGQTTSLSGLQHGGVLAGMILVALVTTLARDPLLANLRAWMIGGCIGSGLALAAIGGAAAVGPGYPIGAAIFALGFCNGTFAVAAIGQMMALAGAGAGRREGTRMGLWGAAQGIAFGAGGFGGTVAVDVARHVFADAPTAYASVFVGEAVLFVCGAVLAARLSGGAVSRRAPARLGQAATAGSQGM
jgi:BCD family chlorophyll transporter-like MFS transporter